VDLYIQTKFEFTMFVVVYANDRHYSYRTQFVMYAIFVWDSTHPEHYVISHFYDESVQIYLERQFFAIALTLTLGV